MSRFVCPIDVEAFAHVCVYDRSHASFVEARKKRTTSLALAEECPATYLKRVGPLSTNKPIRKKKKALKKRPLCLPLLRLARAMIFWHIDLPVVPIVGRAGRGMNKSTAFITINFG